MKFIWTTDLHTTVYHDALKIRKAVFVKEQHVPVNLEIDALESKAEYVVGYQAGEPVTTARIVKQQKGVFKVQRVAVIRQARGKHYGRQLMETVADHVKKSGGQQLVLGAQNHALGFYEKLGYTICSPEYSEAGILHHDMQKTLS